MFLHKMLESATKSQPAMSATCLQPQQGGDQNIDLFLRVVERQRRSNSALDAHAAQDRLSAVMPGTHRDAFLVQGGSDVLSADVIEHERQHTSFLSCGPDQPQTGNG